MSQGFIGEKLGSFRLEEVLGTGAMGVVFRATHETTGRTAAVKIVHGEMGQKGKVYERFEREADILKQFRHPNIVRWLAWGRFKGTSYFAMEYVEGMTLEKLLQQRGEIPWREVIELAIQVCDALHYAHQQGVIHRDLKPSNLLVTNEGKIKLTDFGIAKDLDRTSLTAPGRTLGTAAYMAPEQIRGTPPVSHKTDLYALGVLIYQLLTGKTPFEGGTAIVLMHSHLTESPPRPSAKVEEIPKTLDDLVVNLMAKTPSDRPWDAAAVQHTLSELRDKAARDEPIPMVWPPAGSPGANPSRAGVGPGAEDSRPRRKKSRSSSSGLLSAAGASTSNATGWSLPSRAAIETGSLILALAAIGGFIAYWLWPPSASYLYRQAEPLMQSPRRADWLIARDEYIEPLDRNHPAHPYRDQTTLWRDKILLDQVESRSRVLSGPPGPFNKPNNRGESQYVTFDALVNKATEQGNEQAALGYWREMAEVLNTEDPDDRPWALLARKRGEILENRIKARRDLVLEHMARLEAARREGRPDEVKALRRTILDQFGKYTDVSDLMALLQKEPGNPPANTPPPPREKAQPSAPGIPSAKPGQDQNTEKKR